MYFVHRLCLFQLFLFCSPLLIRPILCNMHIVFYWMIMVESCFSFLYLNNFGRLHDFIIIYNNLTDMILARA
jgi:hypothetical protein